MFSEMGKNRRIKKQEIMKIDVFTSSNHYFMSLQMKVKPYWKRKDLRRRIKKELVRSPCRPLPFGVMHIWIYNTRMRRQVRCEVILHPDLHLMNYRKQ